MGNSERRGKSGAIALAVRIAVGVVVLGLGIAFFAALVATRPEAPRKPRTDAAIPVEVVTARAVRVSRPWEGFGTARSMRVADIRAEVAGVIVRRPAAVEPGVAVRAGETLLEIESADYESAVKRSEAMLASLQAQIASLRVEEDSLREQVALASQASELAGRDVDRAREAAKGGAAIEREIDTLISTLTRTKREESQLKRSLAEVPSRRDSLEAQAEAERANLRLAQENLDRTTITAPFDGVLQSVGFREGERANVGDQAARLVSLARIEVPLRVPVSAASDLRVGARATITSEGQISRSWEATIERISPEADAQSRTITVYAVVEQDPADETTALLLPGRFVRGTLSELRPRARVLTPRIAVQGDSVMVVDEGGVVRRRPVVVAFYVEGSYPQLDPDEREWAAIDRGVEAGDRVVVSNLDDLVSGATVHAQDATAREGVAAGNGRDGEGAK